MFPAALINFLSDPRSSAQIRGCLLLPAQHAKGHIGAGRIVEAPLIADPNRDVVGLNKVVVGKALVEKRIASI